MAGIAGCLNTNSKIEKCHTDIDIINNLTSSYYIYMGGIAGSCGSSEISESYSKGSINVGTQSITGGIVGNMVGNSSSPAKITNAYSTVEISGTGNSNTRIGGIAGIVNTVGITNTYSIGKINVTTANKKGGIVGENTYPNIVSSYWAPEIVGLSRSISTYGEPQLVQTMLYKSSYNGWDFDNIWSIEEGDTLPYLLNNRENEILEANLGTYAQCDGTGTKDNPFLIKNVNDLKAINQLEKVNKYYYKLTDDIDFTGTTEAGAIIQNFKGEIDGNNHKIKNLTINSNTQYIGFIDQIADTGVVKNLNFDNLIIEATVTPTTGFIGGITGFNNGKILNCNVNGTITNTSNITDLYLGGIAGYNMNTISKVSMDGEVKNTGNTSNSYIGGIVGSNELTIERGNNNAIVKSLGTTTKAYLGGIVGYNQNVTKLSENKGELIVNNASYAYVGGIVGNNIKSITNSNNIGEINVNANNIYVGGICGYNSVNTARIAETYNLGEINETHTAQGCVGGIVGLNTGKVENSFYTNDNISEVSGTGEKKSLNELKQKATYNNWNFVNVWSIKDGNSLPKLQKEQNYYDDEYWEWHTRTTTSDQAYNGRHIEITDAINFYGYGVESYKDFLYKEYEFAGEKIFRFQLDESRASYHTLDGAGFIFNAKKENGKITGDVLLLNQPKISLYRLENVDVETFKTQQGCTILSHAKGGAAIASATKPSVDIHQLEIKVTPVGISVIDHGEEILNANIDYSTHAGEDFGLLVSYLQHDCRILTNIEFSDFSLEVKDYRLPVYKYDEEGNPLEDAYFEVYNSEGHVIRSGITDENGQWDIIGLPAGTYTIKEVRAPLGYVLNSIVYKFNVTADGKFTDFETGNEISRLDLENELIEVNVTKYQKDTTMVLRGAKIALCDSEGNILKNASNEDIIEETGTNGITNIVAQKLLGPGTYYYKEVQAPAGYKLNDTLYSFTIDNVGNVTFNDNTNGILYNERIEAIITKQDKDSLNPLKLAKI